MMIFTTSSIRSQLQLTKSKNKMNIEPFTIERYQRDHHGIGTSSWSPTPIGPKVDVVDVVSANSLFLGLDQASTNFLKETFSVLKSQLSLNSSDGKIYEDLFDLGGSNILDRSPNAMLSDKMSVVSSDFHLRDNHSSSPSSSVCTTSDTGTSSSKGCHWTEKFNELVDFHKRFGHCLVPNNWAENVKLSQWVKRQRHQHKLKKEGTNSSLSDDKITALDNLGFTWSVQEDTWEDRFNELQAYRRIHGHTNVPKNCKKHPQLSVWVKYQRRHWRLFLAGERSSMTEERFGKLTSLGFQWNPRKNKSKVAYSSFETLS